MCRPLRLRSCRAPPAPKSTPRIRGSRRRPIQWSDSVQADQPIREWLAAVRLGPTARSESDELSAPIVGDKAALQQRDRALVGSPLSHTIPHWTAMREVAGSAFRVISRYSALQSPHGPGRHSRNQSQISTHSKSACQSACAICRPTAKSISSLSGTDAVARFSLGSSLTNPPWKRAPYSRSPLERNREKAVPQPACGMTLRHSTTSE